MRYSIDNIKQTKSICTLIDLLITYFRTSTVSVNHNDFVRISHTLVWPLAQKCSLLGSDFEIDFCVTKMTNLASRNPKKILLTHDAVSATIRTKSITVLSGDLHDTVIQMPTH